MSTTTTLNGSCGDVLIFQIGGAFTLAASSEIILTGGLTASTVFFVVGGAFTTGASSVFEGVVLGSTTVTLGASSTFVGELNSQIIFLKDVSPDSIFRFFDFSIFREEKHY